MGVYIDFCFTLGGNRLVAAGWGLKDAVRKAFTVRDASGRLVSDGPAACLTHVRPDVPDDRAAGFVMVFDLAGAAAGGGAGSRPADGDTLTFEDDEARTAGRHADSALDDFVAFAGEEPFYTLLVEVAAGRLPPLPATASAAVFERVRTHRRGTVDILDLAAAFDAAFLDRESRGGLAFGWILAAAPERAVAPALLVVDAAGVRDGNAAFAALPRPDLEGFRHRFGVDGRAGFVAVPPAPAASRGGVAAAAPVLVLVVAAGEQVAVTAAVPETVPFDTIARNFSELAIALDPGTRARLRADLTRPLAAPALAGAGRLPGDAAGGPAPGAGAAPVLLLEHDGRGRALREVLGRVAESGLRRFDLALSARIEGSDLRAALDGIARDVPDLELRLLPGDGLAALGNAAADGPLVYVRSSMLMQFDVLPWLAGVARAGLLGRLAVAGAGRFGHLGDGDGGRLAGRDGPPAALAAPLVSTVAGRSLPFAVALGGGAAMRRLPVEARGLLTVGGRMLAAFGRVPEGLGEARRFDGTLFAGDDPSEGARFADGRSPHEFDLETLAAYR